MDYKQTQITGIVRCLWFLCCKYSGVVIFFFFDFKLSFGATVIRQPLDWSCSASKHFTKLKWNTMGIYSRLHVLLGFIFYWTPYKHTEKVYSQWAKQSSSSDFSMSVLNGYLNKMIAGWIRAGCVLVRSISIKIYK